MSLPSPRYRSGDSELVFACRQGDAETVATLIKLVPWRYQINANHLPTFPLMGARKWPEVVRILLTHPGIDPNKHERWGYFHTTLSKACQEGITETVRAILAHPNTDPNRGVLEGDTALALAAEHGHVRCVQLLLARPDIDPNRAMTDGSTPLFWASQGGWHRTVDALLAHRNIDVNVAMQQKGNTPLTIASEFGRIEVVRSLLRHPAIDPNKPRACLPAGAWGDSFVAPQETKQDSPLGIACDEGHLEIVDALLEHPTVDPNQAAAGTGSTPLSWASERGYSAIVKRLLRTDIHVNTRLTDGSTALMRAAYFHKTDVVRELLGHPEIDVNMHNGQPTWTRGRGDALSLANLCDGPRVIAHLLWAGATGPLQRPRWPAQWLVATVLADHRAFVEFQLCCFGARRSEHPLRAFGRGYYWPARRRIESFLAPCAGLERRVETRLLMLRIARHRVWSEWPEQGGGGVAD